MTDTGFDPDGIAGRALRRCQPAELSDPSLLRTALHDYVPNAQREINALLSAADAGAVGTLRGSFTQGLDTDTAIRYTCKALEKTAALDPEIQTWAVSEFARALGHEPTIPGAAQNNQRHDEADNRDQTTTIRPTTIRPGPKRLTDVRRGPPTPVRQTAAGKKGGPRQLTGIEAAAAAACMWFAVLEVGISTFRYAHYLRSATKTRLAEISLLCLAIVVAAPTVAVRVRRRGKQRSAKQGLATALAGLGTVVLVSYEVYVSNLNGRTPAGALHEGIPLGACIGSALLFTRWAVRLKRGTGER